MLMTHAPPRFPRPATAVWRPSPSILSHLLIQAALISLVLVVPSLYVPFRRPVALRSTCGLATVIAVRAAAAALSPTAATVTTVDGLPLPATVASLRDANRSLSLRGALLNATEHQLWLYHAAAAAAVEAARAGGTSCPSFAAAVTGAVGTVIASTSTTATVVVSVGAQNFTGACLVAMAAGSPAAARIVDVSVVTASVQGFTHTAGAALHQAAIFAAPTPVLYTAVGDLLQHQSLLTARKGHCSNPAALGSVLERQTPIWTNATLLAPTDLAAGTYDLCLHSSGATLPLGVDVHALGARVANTVPGTNEVGHIPGVGIPIRIGGGGYADLSLKVFLHPTTCVNGPAGAGTWLDGGLQQSPAPVVSCGAGEAQAVMAAGTVMAQPTKVCGLVAIVNSAAAVALDLNATLRILTPSRLVLATDLAFRPGNDGTLASQPVLRLGDSSGALLSTVPWPLRVNMSWRAFTAGEVVVESYAVDVAAGSGAVEFSTAAFRTARHGHLYCAHFSAVAPPVALAPARANNLTRGSCDPLLAAVLHTPNCEPCPDHARCNGTVAVVMDGSFWRSSPSAVTLHDCGQPWGVAGCAAGTLTGECKEGHTGPLCSTCADGYGRAGNTCVQCASKAEDVVVVAIVVAFMLLCFAVLIALTLRCKKSDQLPIYLKVLLSHLTVASTVGSATLLLPDYIQDIFAAQGQASAPSARLAALDCLFGLQWHGKYVAVNALPAVGLLIGIPIILWRNRNSTAEQLAAARMKQQRQEETSRQPSLAEFTPQQLSPVTSPKRSPAFTHMPEAAPPSPVRSPLFVSRAKRVVGFADDDDPAPKRSSQATHSSDPAAVETSLSDAAAAPPSPPMLEPSASSSGWSKVRRALLKPKLDSTRRPSFGAVALAAMAADPALLRDAMHPDRFEDDHAAVGEDGKVVETDQEQEQDHEQRVIAKRRSLVVALAIEKQTHGGHFLGVVFVATLFYAYPSLVRWNGEALRCHELDTTQRAPLTGALVPSLGRYFYFDRTVSCDDGLFQRYYWAGLVLTALWGLGVPFGFPGLFVYIRVKVGRVIASRMFTFIVAGYRRSVWWWETVLLLRKAGLILIATWVDNIRLRTLLSFWILALHLVAHMVVAPYEYRRVDLMEQASLFVLCGTLNLALLFDFVAADDGSVWQRVAAIALAVGIILMNLAVLAWLVWICAAEALSKLERWVRENNVAVEERYPCGLRHLLLYLAYRDISGTPDVVAVPSGAAEAQESQEEKLRMGATTLAPGQVLVFEDDTDSDWSDDGDDGDDGDGEFSLNDDPADHDRSGADSLGLLTPSISGSPRADESRRQSTRSLHRDASFQLRPNTSAPFLSTGHVPGAMGTELTMRGREALTELSRKAGESREGRPVRLSASATAGVSRVTEELLQVKEAFNDLLAHNAALLSNVASLQADKVALAAGLETTQEKLAAFEDEATAATEQIDEHVGALRQLQGAMARGSSSSEEDRPDEAGGGPLTTSTLHSASRLDRHVLSWGNAVEELHRRREQRIARIMVEADAARIRIAAAEDEARTAQRAAIEEAVRRKMALRSESGVGAAPGPLQYSVSASRKLSVKDRRVLSGALATATQLRPATSGSNALSFGSNDSEVDFELPPSSTTGPGGARALHPAISLMAPAPRQLHGNVVAPALDTVGGGINPLAAIPSAMAGSPLARAQLQLTPDAGDPISLSFGPPEPLRWQTPANQPAKPAAARPVGERSVFNVNPMTSDASAATNSGHVSGQGPSDHRHSGQRHGESRNQSGVAHERHSTGDRGPTVALYGRHSVINLGLDENTGRQVVVVKRAKHEKIDARRKSRFF